VGCAGGVTSTTSISAGTMDGQGSTESTATSSATPVSASADSRSSIEFSTDGSPIDITRPPVAWTTAASAAVVAPSRACNSTTVRALSAQHKSRAKSLCRACPEAWASGLCRSDPSDRAAGLSPLDAGCGTSYINYRIMSHNVYAAAGELPWEFQTASWEGAFAEIDRRLPRYVIDNPGTCAGMA
jgi:hypothetical protein